MDEFMKMLEKAMKEGKVRVVQIGGEPINDESEPEVESKLIAESKVIAELKDKAAEVAFANRILYEAHVSEGFTSDEALALTVATIHM